MDPVVVKVIIDHHSEKLTLSSGVPNTVEQLHETVKDTFQIHEEFTLHYLDEDFGDFFTIHSPNEVKHKGTIKVVIIPSIVLTLTTPETENVEVADGASDISSSTLRMLSSQSSSGSADYQSDTHHHKTLVEQCGQVKLRFHLFQLQQRQCSGMRMNSF
ncbi:unnamed protein product [Arctogadus glacialis]